MPIGIYSRPPAGERFWAKVEKTETCWLWTGAVSPNGYGKFGVTWTPRRQTSPHRFVWESEVGSIPAGMTIDHLCRNKICVNPSHLRVASPRDNALAGTSPFALNSQKRQCLRGHPFDLLNTYYQSGTRQCRQCKRLRGRLHRERKEE